MSNDSNNKAFDHMNEGGKSLDLFGKNGKMEKPGIESFFNFMQIAIADKIFGGEMDPVEGSEWRTGEGLVDAFNRPMKGLDLKDYVLQSGGKSKEGYAVQYGVSEVSIDTLSYQDAMNYDFNITSPDVPGDTAKSKQSGRSLGNPNVAVWGGVVDKYISGFLKKEGGDDPFAAFDDERSDVYNKKIKQVQALMGTSGGFDQLWNDPFWKDAYIKYEPEFGSR